MADSWEDWFGPGETLLWEGTPQSRLRPTPGMIASAVFGLPFLLVGLGLSLGSLLHVLGAPLGWNTAGGLFLFLFGLPFAGAGAPTSPRNGGAGRSRR